MKTENSGDFGQHYAILLALQKILTVTEFEKIFQIYFLEQAKDSPYRARNWLLAILEYPPTLRTPFLAVFFDTANALQQTIISALKERDFIKLLTGFAATQMPFSLERLFFSSNQISLSMQDFYQLWHRNPFPDLSEKIEIALGTGTAAFHKEAFLILKFEREPAVIAEPENFQALVAALWAAEISDQASWQPFFDFLANQRQEIVIGSNPPQTYWHFFLTELTKQPLPASFCFWQNFNRQIPLSWVTAAELPLLEKQIVSQAKNGDNGGSLFLGRWFEEQNQTSLARRHYHHFLLSQKRKTFTAATWRNYQLLMEALPAQTRNQLTQDLRRIWTYYQPYLARRHQQRWVNWWYLSTLLLPPAESQAQLQKIWQAEGGLLINDLKSIFQYQPELSKGIPEQLYQEIAAADLETLPLLKRLGILTIMNETTPLTLPTLVERRLWQHYLRESNLTVLKALIMMGQKKLPNYLNQITADNQEQTLTPRQKKHLVNQETLTIIWQTLHQRKNRRLLKTT